MLFTTGKLSESFSSNALFIFSMDVNINRIYSSLYFQGGDLKLEVPFTAISNTLTLEFAEGERFSYIDGGLRLGYFAVRNNRFHWAPYLSISASKLESNRFDNPNDNDMEFKVFNSFTCGLGMHSEVKLYKYSARNLSQGETTYYLSLKLDAGYNKVVRQKYNDFKGDNPYFNVTLVLGFGDF